MKYKFPNFTKFHIKMDGYKIKIWHLLYLQRYIKLKNSVIILQKSKKFSVFSNKSGWKEFKLW